MADRRRPTPSVSTIPATLPFVDSLARLLLERTADDRSALPQMRVLLPTRRACRALADAFLRLGGGQALLLPRLQPIGDIDEEEFDFLGAEAPGLAEVADLPPAISDLRRRLLLSQMILAGNRGGNRAGGGGAGGGAGGSSGGGSGATPAITMEQASWLAAELARLIDQAHTEGIDLANLADIVPEDHSSHWQKSVEFLRIVTEHWPAVLAAEGAIDPADRRNRLIRAQAAAWRHDPPATPVIAAGSTGTIPATGELLSVIAGLPAGEVILPGLDLMLEDEAWAEVGKTPSHPQYGMHRLLAQLKVDRADVAAWAAPPGARHAAAPAGRLRLLTETFRPAGSTERWADLPGHADAIARGMALPHMLTLAACRGRREEAGAIAVALRRELQADGATAALVTPDRDLAQQVAVILRRWGVAIDDSAGAPLAHSPPALFLRLTAAMVAERFAPVPLLAALKHRLAAAGLPRGRFLAAVRGLEHAVLRGPRPEPGIDGLRRAIAHTDAEPGAQPGPGGGRRIHPAERRAWTEMLDRLEAATAPLAALFAQPETNLPEAVTAHVQAAEALAAAAGELGDGAGDDSGDGAARLWRGEDGEALARFVDDLVQSGGGIALPTAQYPDLFGALLAGLAIRPRYGAHPRVAILGPLEARLQHYGLVVLGGMNEGTWPAAPPADPWMSRAMRAELGLLPVDRRTGLSAHDVAQALGASRVLLTRAQRVEGTPTVASRWWLRLEAVLEGARLIGPAAGGDQIEWRSDALAHFYDILDRVEQPRPAARPAPLPPVAVRPRRISVTQVERWRRDPYAIYARYILGLYALEDLDASPAARDRGTFIHAAIDRFMKDHPDGPLPDDALARLEGFGEAAFDRALDNPMVRAFWWPRFRKIAEWYLGEEADRRAAGKRTLTEVTGEYAFGAPGGGFTLRATADRLEIGPGGALEVADYKTGRVPPPGEVAKGYAPQLPLEALIALDGAFTGLDRGAIAGVEALSYWRLAGGSPAGEVRSALPRKADAPALIEAARDGLHRLVAAFDNPATPYACRPRPYWAPAFDDYEHLARVREWSVNVGEESG